jgi:protein-tyrosine phosphatase
MPHPFDILNVNQNVSLIFTSCPGTKDTSLDDAVLALRGAGAKAIVTLMPLDEMEKFNAVSLPKVCKNLGVSWFHFPIADDSVPGDDYHEEFKAGKTPLFEMLTQNQKVAIHCRGGSGRTGFMAAILLLELGYDWDLVQTKIQTLRPKALVNETQLSYLASKYSIET